MRALWSRDDGHHLRILQARRPGQALILSRTASPALSRTASPAATELIFLGRAGGRMAVATQARASGGLWAVLGGTRVHIDPGPGALVHCHARSLRLDPGRLDAVVLTHKHLDHAGDVNAIVEAMTNGGHRPRGWLLAPRDAYEDDPVILQYVRS